MDRIHGYTSQPIPASDDGDSTWRRTATAHALTTLADALDQHATTTSWLGRTEPRCMTTGWLDTLTPSAITTHLTDAPYRDRHLVGTIVRQALPPVTGTIAQYAQQLRTLAAAA
ncbi:hypothetical protein ABZ650_20465 [Streptomyces griseoviridis]|uniref:hypothetical protein n=1 Tax=Streptomyces griseoviridis TaxID=45398 RepID=UPI0033E9D165